VRKRNAHGVLALIMAVVLASGAFAASAKDVLGRWGGAIDLPTGQALEFFVNFEEQAEGASATLDIPSQGIASLELASVAISDSGEVTFAAPQFGARWTGSLAEAGEAIAGTFEQGGQEMAFALERVEEGAGKPESVVPEGAERWGGVAMVGGVELGLEIAIARADDGAQSAWLTIPLQGINEMALKRVDVTRERMSFRFAPEGAPVEAVFDLEIEGDVAAGSIQQTGQSFPVELKRLAKGERGGELNRPQHPRPPYPYEDRSARFENETDGVTLAGTLTIPNGPGPHPAVILLTGSGPQDRDETLAGHKPFLVIADRLTRRGIAVLRYDDRGVGGSTGSTMDSTVEDFAEDALAAAAWLREQPEIDGARIGLIGHSEGGAVAAEAAARSPETIRCIVSLAGMAETGGETLLRQLPMMLRAGGADEEVVATQLAAQERLIEAIAGDAPDEELRQTLVELMEAQSGQAPSEEALDAQLRFVASPWMRHLITYDPRDAFAQVRAPILAINGEIDRQVDPAANLSAIWAAAAQRGGNEDVTTIILPGLNHLLQSAATGALDEYFTIEQTIAPVALEVMTEWLRERMGLAE